MPDATYTQARRAITLLQMIHDSDGLICSGRMIAESGDSHATVKRLLRMLRDDYDVVLTYHRKRKGELFGYYTIDDWGLLNKRRVLSKRYE